MPLVIDIFNSWGKLKFDFSTTRPWSYSASKIKFPSKPHILWKKVMTLRGLLSPSTSVRPSRTCRKSSMLLQWWITSPSSSDDQQMRLGIKILSSVKKHSISKKCNNGGGGGPCLSSFSSSSSLNSLGSPKLASWGMYSSGLTGWMKHWWFTWQNSPQFVQVA